MTVGKGARGQPGGMRILERLREDGVINDAQHANVLSHAQRSGDRIEDALIDSGAMREADLLKYLAGIYQTRFVSTERLAKADIEPRALAVLPAKIAERLQVCPIVYDKKAQSLAIVCAAPNENEVEKQVQVVTGLREVKAYVARPAAIAAAIAKFYNGSDMAFAELIRTDDFGTLDRYPSSQTSLPNDYDELTPAPFMPARAPAAPRPTLAQAPAQLPPMLPIELAPPVSDPLKIDPDAYLETLNVFVAMLEQDRGELRGHSAQVAQLCRRMAERAGLASRERHALLVAAYLHDVGKHSGAYHLTALNVARYEGHRSQAQKSHGAPARLFASAVIPAASVEILAHLYERFDGQGFPDRQASKDIPFGSRVLAMAETFADLSSNSRNPYRRVLTLPEAVEVVRGLAPALFDPALTDLLRLVVLGDSQDAAASTRPRALLVDPDAEETTVLEMRLIEHGFRVAVARDVLSARSELADPPAVVIAEVALGAGPDGFELLRAVNEIEAEKRPAFVFLTSRGDRETVARGFELGAADYLIKPASPDVVAAKAEQLASGRGRPRTSGVNGSLREMALPELVQILAQGRKGGRLLITGGGKRGEIHFLEGQVHNASFAELRGEEAFYAMLKLDDGNFTLDAAFVPTERLIHASAEGLLLEGMRRLDEGLA